jgi:hypothetical protein
VDTIGDATSRRWRVELIIDTEWRPNYEFRSPDDGNDVANDGEVGTVDLSDDERRRELDAERIVFDFQLVDSDLEEEDDIIVDRPKTSE